MVSSPCLVLGERPPYAVQMLQEVFGLSVRDYDVLVLCSEAPLTQLQCNESRRQSASALEERGFLTYIERKYRWELTVLGQCTMTAIAYYVSQYQPALMKNAAVISFPKRSPE